MKRTDKNGSARPARMVRGFALVAIAASGLLLGGGLASAQQGGVPPGTQTSPQGTAISPPESAVSAEPAASADSMRISLGDATDRALRFGEDMARAGAQRQTAHARYLQARSTALPQLSFSGTYTRQIESIFQNEGGGGIEAFSPDTTAHDSTTADLLRRIRALERALPNSGFLAVSQLLSSSSFASKNSWIAALSLRQKVLQGGSIWASVAAAKHGLSAARLLEDDRKADVALAVRQAYLDALLARRGVRIAELGYEQANNHFERVRLRQEAGQASEFELLQAEVQRDNQVPILRGAYTQREATELELRRLASLPVDRPLTLTTPLLDESSIPAEPANIDTTGLVAAALTTSGVEALSEAYQARGHAVTVAAAGKYPELSLFLNGSEQAYPGKVIPRRGDWRRDASAGAAISWNVFDGFLTKGQIEEAKANRTNAQQDLIQARKQVRQAVILGEFELQRSASDLRARSRTVQLARRALDLANLRFEEGASSQLEVSDARIAWQIAQSNEAQARRDYFAALARLERFTGRPVFESHVPVTQ